MMQPSINKSLLIAVALVGSSCSFLRAQDGVKYVSKKGTTEVSDPLAAAPPIGLTELYLQGIAKPKYDAELRPGAQGTVIAVHVEEGQWVTKGTPLITLDDRVAQATVSVAQAAAAARGAVKQAELAMQEAQSLMSRTEIALRVNASSEFELASKRSLYEQAVAAYEQQVEVVKSAVAELKLAEAQRELLTLRAPFDGEVLKVGVKLGNTVDPTQVAVRVANLKLLSVEMHLPLNLFGSVLAGNEYNFKAGAPVNEEVSARAEFISRVVEPTSGTFRARFQIENASQKLPAGFEIWYQDVR